MKVIKKTISLEQFKSRTPSMIDFIDGAGCFVDLNTEDIIINKYPNGCYNETPCDLYLDKNLPFNINKRYLKKIYGIGDITDYSEICYSIDDYCTQPTLQYYAIPYGTLKTIYHFFLNYIKLLRNEIRNSNGEICQKMISSATEYWEQVVKDSDLESYYKELDTQFADYGGLIETNNNEIKIAGFAEYIITQLFKVFTIPEEFVDYWKTDKLYAVEAIWWKKWFEEKYNLYKSLSDVNCNDKTDDCLNPEPKYDCCDCYEYFQRGGHKMYDLLRSFKITDVRTSSASTSIDIPLYIGNTIDNIGEYTIFSEEWQGGVDYTPKVCDNNIMIDKCQNTEYHSGGTMVIYEDNLYLKKCDGPGFINGDCKIDFKFVEDEWELKLTGIDSWYQNEVYTYNLNNVAFIFPNETNAKSPESATKVAVIKDLIHANNGYGFILFYSTLYEIEKMKFILEPKTQTYIKVEKDFDRYYVYYNDKKYFSEDKEGTIFNLTKIPCISSGKEIEVSEDFFVKIGNVYFKINDTKEWFTIEHENYGIIDSYFIYDNSNYYIRKNKICDFKPSFYTDGITNVTENFQFGSFIDSASTDNTSFGFYLTENLIYLYSPYEIHKFGMLSGYTTSKLEQLQRTNLSCDDLGQTLLGYFEINENSKYVQPLEDSVLDLYYKVGDVTNLSDVPMLVDGEYQTGTTFWGNYLQEMSFYYVDIDGNITSSKKFKASEYDKDNLRVIKAVQEDWFDKLENQQKFGKLDKNIFEIPDKLKCEFVYYIGCILKQAANSIGFTLLNEENKYLNGVKYIDVVTLEKETEEYYLNKTNYYNIFYYKLIHDQIEVSYGSVDVKLPKTYFEVYIDHIGDNTDGVYFTSQNTMIDSPIFKEEMKMGVSSLQKIEEEIYIDRPIIKPHEKNLQIIDVMSLEALESYSNGGIKILKN